MRRFLILLAVSGGAVAQQPFTLRQVLSAPYALSLTASPVGGRFAWVENAEGVRNLWVGGAGVAARRLTAYSEDDAQDIGGLEWSPDGTAIAYAYGAESGADGKPANPAHLQRSTAVQVVVQPVAAGVSAVVVGEGHAPLFTRDGRGLIFVRAGQIWMAGLSAGEKPYPLVVDRGSASGMTLSPDGGMLAFVSRRKEHSFIGLFDLKAKTLRFVGASSEVDFAPVFSGDGREIAWLRRPVTQAVEYAVDRVSAEPWAIEVAEVATGGLREVFQPEANKFGSVLPRFATGSPRVWWTKDGRVLFCSEADGWVHLYAVDAGMEHGKAVLLTPGKGEIEDVSVAGDVVMWASNQVAGDVLDEDRRHLWKLDLSAVGAKPVQVTRGEGMETRPEMAADGTLSAMVSDARRPMAAAVVGSGGTLSAMNAADAVAGYPAKEMVVPAQVMFMAADGVRVHGQLFLPKGESAGPRAALIFVHGGPRREMLLGYPAMDYYSNAYAMNQYLVSRGFVVLSVNYRGGIGYGLKFRQPENYGPHGASEYLDVLAGVKYLRGRKDVDAKRIGIWGGSYGGYLTALALARNSDLFAAGVDFHGIHDWNLEDNASDWLRGSYTEKDAIAAGARRASAISDVARWRSPVLLIHGDNDPEVAYAQTPMIADALKARGVKVEELVFPDEVHGFLLHKDWVEAYEKEAAFFERVLGGQEAGSRK